VVLVDANFRHPTIHTALGIPNTSGLSRLLLDFGAIGTPSARYGAALTAVPDVMGLRVLTTGPIPPNPAELLSSSRMEQLLRAILAGSLGQGYTDVIVLDTAPVTLYPETAALACRVDAVDSLLLVIDGTRSRRGALSRARDCLAGAESKIIGAVFNRGAVLPSRKPDPPVGDDEASAIDSHAEQHPLLVTEIAGGDDTRPRLLQDEGDDLPQSLPHIASGNRAEWNGEISV